MQGDDALGAPGIGAPQIATLSDAGRVRAENQDAVAVFDHPSGERLLIVADGMGGHRGGETASRICLEAAERAFLEPQGAAQDRLRRCLELANEEIYAHSLEQTELRGMGTTSVAALLAPDGSAWLAWVGDSRGYRLRGRRLDPLTRDHSLMTEWISLGVITAEASKTHPRRHELMRALGQAPDVVVDVVEIEFAPGDRLLLCSDGLHGYMAERAIATALGSGTVDEAAHALVSAANECGGADNVSVVVASLPEALPEAATDEPDTSFADIAGELSEAAPEEPVAEGIAEAEAEPDFLPPSAQQIQIPLMTPVRASRALDFRSLAIGAATSLAIVGLCFGFFAWFTTSAPSVEPHAPRPTPVLARPAAPAAQPAPTRAPEPERVVARAPEPAPQPKPQPKTEPAPVVERKSEPRAAPAPEPKAAPAPVPAAEPTPKLGPTPPAKTQPDPVPAAPAPALADAPRAPRAPPAAPAPGTPAPALDRFELTPPVERFLVDWLGALAAHDLARLGRLGFREQPTDFAGTPDSRDDFRLVLAEIDEERSQEGRVYLRLIVSYAFTDANGRFRTQDEQRMILGEAGGRLRFLGSWRQ